MEPISIIRVALRVLNERMLTMLALIMTFGLSAWEMWRPDFQRAGMAAFFAVAVFLPCVIHERKRGRDEKAQGQGQAE